MKSSNKIGDLLTTPQKYWGLDHEKRNGKI